MTTLLAMEEKYICAAKEDYVRIFISQAIASKLYIFFRTHLPKSSQLSVFYPNSVQHVRFTSQILCSEKKGLMIAITHTPSIKPHFSVFKANRYRIQSKTVSFKTGVGRGRYCCCTRCPQRKFHLDAIFCIWKDSAVDRFRSHTTSKFPGKTKSISRPFHIKIL